MQQTKYQSYSRFFFSTPQWRELRLVAIQLLGTACLCCKKQNLSGSDLHVDHVIPRIVDLSRQLDLTNVQILCAACNGYGGKGRQTIDYRSPIQVQLLIDRNYVCQEVLSFEAFKPIPKKSNPQVAAKVKFKTGTTKEELDGQFNKLNQQRRQGVLSKTLYRRATRQIRKQQRRLKKKVNRRMNLERKDQLRLERVSKYLAANPDKVC